MQVLFAVALRKRRGFAARARGRGFPWGDSNTETGGCTLSHSTTRLVDARHNAGGWPADLHSS